MRFQLKYKILFISVIFIAVALRLPGLAQRPMHTDEAVHAIKFGQLLENGTYQYDPYEYHGPTLNYFTLLPAWLSGAHKITCISEVILRIVPVVFGMMLIILLILISRAIGYPAIISAALFTAISPAMVYYSRYYIQEMLLICFTLGAIVSGYRYWQSKNLSWIISAGIFLGLMHATKETCIIAWTSMGLALIFISVMNRGGQSLSTIIKSIPLRHILALIAAAGCVSILFFSSFFSHWPGIIDSMKTYTTYFDRAGGSEIHVHPWYFYIKLIGFYRLGNGPVWSEWIIILLALFGAVFGFAKKELNGIDKIFVRFIALYTLFMLLIYSLIPYKTPWCLLNFLIGMTILAGVGMISLIRQTTKRLSRIILIIVLGAGCFHLIWQAYTGNFKYAADPVNPYVYAHTSPDILRISERIHEIANISPQGKHIHIEVICPGHDYWPLPWYFRDLPNVGWWEKVDFSTPAAPIIIAIPEVEPELIRKLYDMPAPGEIDLYIPLFDSSTNLRPGVELRTYYKKELWDVYQAVEKN